MTETYIRKMAYIAKVTKVIPIPDADKICQYEIDEGWNVVDQVGKYVVGDIVIYAAIDAWIPSTVAPFLSKGKEPRVYNGVKGEKLRTIRLRRALSQGLILPMTVLDTPNLRVGEWNIGDDVANILGIQKWEPPPEFTSADAKGLFPSYCPKSDQERVQNCYRNIEQYLQEETCVTFEITEKVEGQSHSAIFYNGEFQVCSRNLSLKDADNTFWNTARKYDLENKMRNLGRNLMIQSEQVGPGIQGNIYGLTDYHLFVYDIYDIDKGEFLAPAPRRELTKQLGLTDVPVLASEAVMIEWTLKQFLDYADGYSVIGFTNTLREGIVFKANYIKRVSFKAVSNKYLTNEKD